MQSLNDPHKPERTKQHQRPRLGFCRIYIVAGRAFASAQNPKWVKLATHQKTTLSAKLEHE